MAAILTPLAIDEILLQDLVEYKGSKAKGVNMAAKSLIALYRDVAPEMLKKKDRGKNAAMEVQEAKKGGKDSKRPQFGADNSVQGIAGIELLAKWKKEHGDPLTVDIVFFAIDIYFPVGISVFIFTLFTMFFLPFGTKR